MQPISIRGLYAITPETLDDIELFDKVSAVLRGGAQVIQYRDKTNDAQTQLRRARRLRMLCLEYNALLIVNDSVPLCLDCDADGVHLGRNDAALNATRRTLGDKKIIGVSCYNRLQFAVQAEANGASYVAFGRFFDSVTKPNAVRAPISLLADAKDKLTIPIVAIGGITLDNGADLVAAGADALAVINGLFSQANIDDAAQAFTQMF